jgi:hypothetical protein
MTALENATIPPRAIVITTIELETALLSTMTNFQLQNVKHIAQHSSILCWITGGGLYKSSNPDFALVLGLSRSLMLEHPMLKMPVIDLDPQVISPDILASNVISVLNQVLHSENPDLEYRQHNDVLYSSRIVPDVALNQIFRRTRDAETIRLPISEAGRCRLAIKNVGQIDSLHYVETEYQGQITKGYLEVEVRAMGMNAKVRHPSANAVMMRDSQSVGLTDN